MRDALARDTRRATNRNYEGIEDCPRSDDVAWERRYTARQPPMHGDTQRCVDALRVKARSVWARAIQTRVSHRKLTNSVFPRESRVFPRLLEGIDAVTTFRRKGGGISATEAIGAEA